MDRSNLHSYWSYLDSRKNNLISNLPESIAGLKHLEELAIWGNQFIEVPQSIQQLTSIKRLDLSNNQISLIPEWIGQLTRLTSLSLHENRLSELPDTITQLKQLQELYIHDNRFTDFPEWIRQLTGLTKLDVSGNQLTAIPSWIGELTQLTHLWLEKNQLQSLPETIGNLASLEKFKLEKNQLKSLPDNLGILRSLRIVDLSQNLLRSLPDNLSNLSELEELYLDKNELTRLDLQIGALPKLKEFSFSDNLLPAFMRALAECKTEERLAYFRSLRDGQPIYKAKVLLVGEGGVGKSSLLAALKDEEFIEDRQTTHGIEIEQLREDHPEEKTPVWLNFWDFGGQEVYRISHQFFFSEDALYLLVWNPRQGVEQNLLENWIQRIKLRVGDTASIILVATHCKTRRPEIDFDALQEKYSPLLVALQEVDNCDGSGIQDLHEKIVCHALELRHLGLPFHRNWMAAREEILQARTNRTHIGFDEFAEVCKKHEMTDTEAKVLIVLMHTLGELVFYDEEFLRNFIVLQPEWLTKALSYLLDDRSIEKQSGILYHRQLKSIWSNTENPDRVQYDPQYYPHFLRLMELYDVSYRLESEEDASLIGQRVPFKKPSFEWTTTISGRPSQLRLILKMDTCPDGIIEWCIVRFHRWSQEKHWRTGMFLKHKVYNEALVELNKEKAEVKINVKGAVPSEFMSLLQDGLERLIELRWPHLEYGFQVPCYHTNASGQSCKALVPLEYLRNELKNSSMSSSCRDCYKELDHARLLTGFDAQPIDNSQEIDEIKAGLTALQAGQQQILDQQGQFAERHRVELAQAAIIIRKTIQTYNGESANGPRLFSLTPRNIRDFHLSNWGQHLWGLTLWCEQPGCEHPLPEARYELKEPHEWLAKIGVYLQLVGKILDLALPVASRAWKMLTPDEWSDYNGHIKLTQSIAASIVKGSDYSGESMSLGTEHLDRRVTMSKESDALESQHTEHAQNAERRGFQINRQEGAGLRAFHELLNKLDETRTWGGLRRVEDQASGDLLWVCEHHYKEHYNPGLPQLPDYE